MEHTFRNLPLVATRMSTGNNNNDTKSNAETLREAICEKSISWTYTLLGEHKSIGRATPYLKYYPFLWYYLGVTVLNDMVGRYEKYVKNIF